MSLQRWLTGKKMPRQTVRGFVNPNPAPITELNQPNKILFSNIDEKYLSLNEIRSKLHGCYVYEMLLTVSDKTLSKMTTYESPSLDKSITSILRDTPKNTAYYFIKEYAPGTNRPHYHGVMGFVPSRTSKDPYKLMVRRFHKFMKSYRAVIGYVQYSRINNLHDTYKPTEQNLHCKRHVGEMALYWVYIHKDIKHIDLIDEN